MFSRSRHAVAAMLLGAVLGGCGADSPAAPLDSTTGTGGTLADAIGQLSSPALAAAGAVSGVPYGALDTAFDPSTCAYSASTQSFACPTLSTGSGLVVERSYTLLDASGARQSAYSATTTSAVRANTSVTGTVTSYPASYALDARQELTLTGLRTGTHVLDGTSTAKASGTASGLATPFVTVKTATIDKLVLPAKATGPSAWPTSGSVTVESKSLVIGVPAPTLVTVKLTFTGSSRATVAISSPGYSQTCTVDLASQAPNCS